MLLNLTFLLTSFIIFISFFILQLGTILFFIVYEKILKDVWVFTRFETTMLTKFCIKHIFDLNIIQIMKCRNIIFTNGIFSSSLLEMKHLSMGHAEISNNNPELDLSIWNIWNDLEIPPNYRIALRTVWNTWIFEHYELL